MLVSFLLLFVSCPVKNSIAEILDLPIAKTLNPSKSISSGTHSTCGFYKHHTAKQLKAVKKAEVLLPFHQGAFSDPLFLVNKPIAVYKQDHFHSTSKIPLYILYQNRKDFIV